MKTLILTVFFLILSNLTFCQSNNWSTLDYHYSNGPVSPEYQYNFNVIITREGAGTVYSEKNGKMEEYTFTVGRKSIKKLNKTLKNSKVFKVNQDSLKSETNRLGGSVKSLVITMWESPVLDQKPRTISVPNNVKSEYENCFGKLYSQIENLVPDSIYEKIKK